MKSTLVRVLVLALSVAGFGASAVQASSNQKTAQLIAQGGAKPAVVPLCVPSDPSHCGMDGD